jgi:sialidase-1
MFKQRYVPWSLVCAPTLLLAISNSSSCFSAPQKQSSAPIANGFESVNLWNGGIGGYGTYRIPGIVVTKRGTVIAYTSARRDLSFGDWSDIDIVLRRSTDGGRTWEPSRRIAGDSKGVTDNPVAIVDSETGVIHFLFQKDYARCYYMHSEDDGRTFSEPVDITAVFEQFRTEYDWHVIAPGVGHAIQLRNGRLLVPIWMSIGKQESPRIRAHRPSAVATIYSDDHGRTWKRGDIIVNSSDQIPNPSESMAVQLSDGSVMMNIRNESTRHRRVVSVSPDGATHWSTPRFDETLFEPVCAASIIRYSLDRRGGRGSILFSNPDSETIPGVGMFQFRARQNLTLRMSYDEGRTWPVQRVIDPGVTGYSDLAVGPDKTIYCIYESGAIRGSEGNNPHITVARFNLAWLMNEAGTDRQ